MAVKCAGCPQLISSREYLTCYLCKDIYDLECANVSIQRFLNTMTPEHKKSWKCQNCKMKEPRKDNSNTPIRPQQQTLTTQAKTTDFTCSNVTLRSNKIKSQKSNKTNNTTTSFSDDLGVLDDTLNSQGSMKLIKEKIVSESKIEAVTIEQIEMLLDNKLETYKQSLLIELKSTITSWFSKEISQVKEDMLRTTKTISEITHTTDTLNNENAQFREQLQQLNISIASLDQQNQKLQKQIKEIELFSNNQRTYPTNNYDNTNKKIIVLYGLKEIQWEDEYQLYNRVISLFQEILNTDLMGYIEDIKRLGKRGHRRPLQIELLSKNVTTYILKNRRAFKNTGMAVSELLEGETLQNRRKLIETLIAARKNGHRASIINNKLIINGKEFTQTDQTQEQTSHRDITPRPSVLKDLFSENSTTSMTSDPVCLTRNGNDCEMVLKPQLEQNDFFRK
jgi:hypothetical protein